MKLDDIEIGKDYADDETSRYPHRLRVLDIGKVEEPTRWGRRTELSKVRKVTVMPLRRDGTEYTEDTRVVPAQKIVQTWEDHLARKARNEEIERERKEEREAKKAEALEQQARILEILSVLEDFDTREDHEGNETIGFGVSGIKMDISSYGNGKVEMSYERLLEFAEAIAGSTTQRKEVQ